MVDRKCLLPIGGLIALLIAAGVAVLIQFTPREEPVVETDPAEAPNRAEEAAEDESPSGVADEEPAGAPLTAEAEAEAMDRLGKILAGGEIDTILPLLDGLLEEGLPVNEGAGQVYDSALPLETKIRLLEHLLGAEACRPMDRVTIAWYFHHLGVQGKSAKCLARAVFLIPDQVWFLRDLLDADPDAVMKALSALDPALMTNAAALDLIVNYLAERKEGTLLAGFANRLFELQPTTRLAFQNLMRLDPDVRLARLERQVKEDPKNPNAWAGWATAQLEAGRPFDAFEAFRKAADLDPGNPDYFQGLIEADPARAAEVLRAFYDDRPDDSEAAGKYGRALIAAGRKEEAFTVLLDALKQEPEDPEWMDLLLEIEPSRTRKTLEAWIRKAPEDGLLHGIMGRALVEGGDRTGGYDAYARAFELEGFVVWAHGMVEADPARALPELKKTLGFTPEKIASLRNRMASSDEPLNPVEVFGRLRSGDFNLLGELGLAMVETGNVYDGLPLIEYALDSGHVIGEQESVLIGALGRADRRRGRSRLEAMAAEDETDSETWGRVGHGYRAMGLTEDALLAFEKARTLEPTNEEWITAIRELTTRGK
jgi:cytochrome c-type biogenesis protein CcmH/NrfG